MNILFLDIDGVLNSQNWFKSEAFERARATFKEKRMAGSNERTAAELRACHIDPDALTLLKKCIQDLKLTVVLSSTWRTLPSGIEALKQAGLSFIGMTPEISSTRGLEIQAWIDQNNVTGNFAILDDDDNMEHLHPHLIQTFFCTGFTEREARQLRERFELLRGDGSSS
jgi:hypothetical protein